VLYLGAHGTAAELTQNQFYEDLAAELIDNTFNTVGLWARGTPAVVAIGGTYNVFAVLLRHRLTTSIAEEG